LICDSRKTHVYTLEFEIDGMVCWNSFTII
jgi:hypothetical protein